MKLTGILVAQAAPDAGAVLSTGWLDPLFVGFLIAAFGQLTLILLVLVSEPRSGRGGG